MLEVANYVAHVAQLTLPSEIQAAFDMPRYAAAKALRLDQYGLQIGNPANFVLIDATDPHDALRRQADRLLVVRDGNVLVESERRVKFSPKIPA